MTRFRSRYMLVIAITVSLAATAWAEKIFRVNTDGSGNWVFDQPSVVANGTVLHLAFVGDNAAGAGNPSLNTRLYYAAVNGGADFTNKLTTDTQVLVTPPFAIDNTLFSQARHPQIALLSAAKLAILFQAIPSDNTAAGSKLFLALVTINNNTVTSQSVSEVRDTANARIPGGLTDPSYGIVTTDNTLRVAYSSFPSLVAPSPYRDVYYARVAWDNARVLGTPILLNNTNDNSVASSGVFPLPRLRLDGNNFSHIVWAANSSDPTQTTSGVYYAMVHAVAPSVVDNLAIGATQVLSGTNRRWGFPNVLLTGPNNVWILAADEPPSEGFLGITEINPYAVVQDGNPVSVNNVGANTSFFYNPPGGTVLSGDFSTYQPEAEFDSLNRLQIGGYGFRSDVPPYKGSPGRYYVMSVGTAASGAGTSSVFASMIGSPVSVGIGDISFATQLPGDYTRPAFVHFSGKAVSFWSGPDNVVTGARNLYFTSNFSPPDPTQQSGCSMVADPRGDDAGRIPGAAVLLLPAALLALRKATRKAFARP